MEVLTPSFLSSSSVVWASVVSTDLNSLDMLCFGASQVVLAVRNPLDDAGNKYKNHRFDPWVWKIPWRRAWQPTLVFLPGEISCTEEPGGLQSMGLQRVGHD